MGVVSSLVLGAFLSPAREARAQSRFEEALAHNPKYAEAHYALGTGFLLAKQPERALDAYRAALAGHPDYPEALFGAARAELELGRTDQVAKHDGDLAPLRFARRTFGRRCLRPAANR